MAFAKLFAEIFRDYILDGVPSSGAQKPIKADIRAWGAVVEAAFNQNAFTDIASAATTDLSTPGATAFNVTGVATITSFGSVAAAKDLPRVVKFAGVLVLTNSATLVLPGGKDITTAAGDRLIAISDRSATPVWTVLAYIRADGHYLTTGFASIASAATTDLGSTLAQTLTISGSVNITSFGSTAPTGAIKDLYFSGAPLISFGANIITLDGLDVQIAAGDTAALRHEGAGVWRFLYLSRNANIPTASPGGRLTLTTLVPVMTASVTGATTVRYTPYLNNAVPLWNGTQFVMRSFSEMSQATTDTTKSPAAVANNSNYDMLVWDDAGTMRCTRGPTWATGGGSDTARGTGAGSTELEMVNGILVNKFAITNGPAARKGTYVGTVRSNGTASIDWIFGTSAAGGGAAVHGVWNCYNRVLVASQVFDSTTGYAYTTTTIRAADGSNTNRVSYIYGLNEDEVDAIYNSAALTGAGNSISTGVGIDSTTVYSGASADGNSANRQNFPATYRGYPGLGFHFVQALERGNTGGTFNSSSTTGALQVMLRM